MRWPWISRKRYERERAELTAQVLHLQTQVHVLKQRNAQLVMDDAKFRELKLMDANMERTLRKQAMYARRQTKAQARAGADKNPRKKG